MTVQEYVNIFLQMNVWQLGIVLIIMYTAWTVGGFVGIYLADKVENYTIIRERKKYLKQQGKKK